MIGRAPLMVLTLALLLPALPGRAEPPAGAKSPASLQALETARWSLSAARPRLPRVDAEYREQTETRDFVEYALDGGALRLFADSRRAGAGVFALLADTRVPRYADFAGVESREGLRVDREGPFTVVVAQKPLAAEVFDRLKSKSWKETDLARELGGPPDYTTTLRGLGWRVLVYVRPGLSFVAEPPRGKGTWLFQLAVDARDVEDDLGMHPPALESVAAAEYAPLRDMNLSAVTRMLLEQRKAVDDALAQGKRSPDGRTIAAVVNLGGLRTTEEFVLAEKDRPERRLRAGEAVIAHLWLDGSTLVFETNSPIDTRHFQTLALRTGKITEIGQFDCIALPGNCITERGVTPPGEFWFRTADGETHRVKTGRK